jgi:anti-sigma B factor antagonist
MDLTVHVAELRGWVIVAVGGEVDMAAAPELRARLMSVVVEFAGRPVAVDLGGVGFVDSAGLGVLIGALRRITEAGGRMALVDLRPSVQRVFAITGLNAVFDVRASREDLDG